MPPRGFRLFAYAWRVALVRAAGAFALLLGMYVLVDGVESASAARVSLSRMASLYPYKLPLIAAHVAPVAVSIAVVLGLGALRRRGEWDAAAAAGIAPRAMLGGLLAVPFACALAAVPLVHSAAPLALARYEAGTFPAAAPRIEGRHWLRDGRRLERVRDTRPGAALEIEIERDDGGRALAWDGPCGDGERRCSWRRAGAWEKSGGPERRAVLPREIPREPVPTAYGLVGASLTSARLAALAGALERQGQTAFGLKAERSLRTALAAACAIVPALALLLAIASGTTRDARLVGIGLGAAALYWLALSLAWNGASSGALCARWVDTGVPLSMAIAIAAIAGFRAATRRT
jgi:hypothetical protein